MYLGYATLGHSNLVSDPVSHECYRPIGQCVWYCTIADHFVYMVQIDIYIYSYVGVPSCW